MIRLKPSVYRTRTRAMLRRQRTCECNCGRSSHEIHHVIGGVGRDDVPANWTCINHLCHMAFTSKNRVWDPQREVWIDPKAVAVGLRYTMETRRLDTLEYVILKKGREWLSRRYPEV